MHSQTDQPTATDATAALDGIIALLAATGLSDNQIAAVTGRDARPVRALLDAAAEPPAREWSVLDRARAAVAARGQR